MLARARTVWVFVDTGTGRSRDIPNNLRAAFDVVGDEKEVLRMVQAGGV